MPPPVRPPLPIRVRQTAEGFRALRDRVGLGTTLALLARAGREAARGEPWPHLEPPASRAEASTREQAAPVILLYRALRRHRPGEALSIAREVTVQAAVPWMRHALAGLDPDAWDGLDGEVRRERVRSTANGFPNMEVRDVETSPEGASFRVVACRFPGLCREAGVPELAPVFCAVDAHYFGGVEPRFRLDRPHTLAEGGPDCPFAFSRRPRTTPDPRRPESAARPG